jgi:5'-3' exoribonuclease 2
MLGLATHEPYFRVLREDVFFQEAKARTCRICGQKGHKPEECRGEEKKREGEFDEKDKTQRLKPFLWLHVPVLREYLEAELYVPSQHHPFDLERAIDDWVFMCFFVGNDFLPHLPSLDIRENGIDTLIAIWRDSIPVMGGYLTKDGHVDLGRAQLILDGLARQEDAIFQRRRQVEERREENNKRQKLEKQMRESNSRYGLQSGPRGHPAPADQVAASNQKGRGRPVDPVAPPLDLPLFAPGNITKEAKAVTYDMAVNRGSIYKANLDNKSAAAALKSQLQSANFKKNEDKGADKVGIATSLLADDPERPEHPQIPASALGKRKADLIEEDEGTTPGGNSSDTSGTPIGSKSREAAPDTIRLWEQGYADRYYEQKFSVDPKDVGFRHKVARAYVEGLAWVLLYYFQGCPSWTWYYPYHYAPFAADFINIDQVELTFERGEPFKPFEQLMGVLPAASKHALPEVFHGLMTEEDSEIIDFYPEEFPIDLNGKKFAWQGVALLPFIDEKRLLKAMAKKYPLLSAEDGARNEMGKDVLLVSDSHPLYNELAVKFYSKKRESDKHKLNPSVSEGLAGIVEKHDSYLPRSTLTFPLENQGMPHLEDDRSIRFGSLPLTTCPVYVANTSSKCLLRYAAVHQCPQIHVTSRRQNATTYLRSGRH